MEGVIESHKLDTTKEPAKSGTAASRVASKENTLPSSDLTTDLKIRIKFHPHSNKSDLTLRAWSG